MGTCFAPPPVAVIGAGPVGIAAAAHPATRGLDFVVLEAGRSVAVVGVGHSATGTLLALAELADVEPGTTVHWLPRAETGVCSSSGCCG